MFLLYINDINLFITETICVMIASYIELLNQIMTTIIYSQILMWYLHGHGLGKCRLMSINVQQWDVIDHYNQVLYLFLNGESLNCVTDHFYLGVLLSSSMSFSPHVNNIVVKASRMLNFIRRNLSKCSEEMKSTAYLSLVCPTLEYSSSVCDPYLFTDIQSIVPIISWLSLL